MSPEAQIAVLATKVESLEEDGRELRQNVDAAGVRLTTLERYAQWGVGFLAAMSAVGGFVAFLLSFDPIKKHIGLG